MLEICLPRARRKGEIQVVNKVNMWEERMKKWKKELGTKEELISFIWSLKNQTITDVVPLFQKKIRLHVHEHSLLSIILQNSPQVLVPLLRQRAGTQDTQGVNKCQRKQLACWSFSAVSCYFCNHADVFQWFLSRLEWCMYCMIFRWPTNLRETQFCPPTHQSVTQLPAFLSFSERGDENENMWGRFSEVCFSSYSAV